MKKWEKPTVQNLSLEFTKNDFEPYKGNGNNGNHNHQCSFCGASGFLSQGEVKRHQNDDNCTVDRPNYPSIPPSGSMS